jgi:hypothetical protein
MVRQVQSMMGNTGYRHQLDRARRFRDRFEAARNDVEFQDMMWAFFQNCWHLKDWVKHDPLASQAQKHAVKSQVHQSTLLLACRDLCNGTKHLKLDRPSLGTGTSHEYVNTMITPGSDQASELDCVLDDGYGQLISGKKLACDCLDEWVRILESQGLNTTRIG